MVLPKENHMKLTEAATLDRKSGEAEGSAVPRTITGDVEYDAQIELSSRLPRLAVGPERTRISCLAALDTTTCAAFIKESRMRFTDATKSNRKPGVAQWRDLRFLLVLT